MEPLEPYITTLGDPLLDGLNLSNILVRLRAVQRREEGEADNIAMMVADRSNFIEKLARRLERRIADLGEDTTEEESASGNDHSDLKEEIQEVGSDARKTDDEEDAESSVGEK